MDFIDHRSTANFIFSLSATDEKLRIKSDGNVGIGVSNPSTKLEVDGVITTAGLTTTADINFGDNDKAIFGAGSDLQIYHDGSHSRLVDSGAGNFIIQAGQFRVNTADDSEAMIKADVNGAVTAYHNGSSKLSTTSTGINVTGTVTADGLTVDTGSTFALSATLGHTGGSQLFFLSDDGGTRNQIDSQTNGSSAKLDLATGGTKRQRIDANGDISFYEDTGTTAKFFWDASKESLGIGTTSLTPTDGANIELSSSTSSRFLLDNTGASGRKYAITSDTSGNLGFYDYDASAFRILVDSSGNVGIGTTSPETNLHIEDSSSFSIIRLVSSTTENAGIDFGDPDDRDIGRVRYNNSDNSMVFHTNAAEQMRIDSAGRVGIGTSSPSSALHITASHPTVYLETSGGGATDAAYLQKYSNDVYLYNKESAGKLYLGTNNATKVTLDSSGNVGIGTSSPSAPLDVVSSSGAVGAYIRGRSSDNIGSLYFTSNSSASTEYGYVQGRSTDLRIQGFNNGLILQPSGGNVGIGTSSPASKLDINGDGTILRLDGTANTSRTLLLRNVGGSAEGIIQTDGNMHFLQEDASKYIRFSTANTERMRIDSSGNVGIGTSSPNDKVDISGSTGDGYRLTDGTHTGVYRSISGGTILKTTSNHALLFGTNDTERMRISSSGNLRVGVGNTFEPTIQFTNSGRVAGNPAYSFNGDLDTGMFNPSTQGTIAFANNGSESMRIDASGNLLVGGTSACGADTITLGTGGFAGIRNTSGSCLELRRDSTDGSILDFQKNGTAVGSIQTNSGRLDIQGNANTVRVQSGTSLMQVTNGTQISFETAGSERMRIDASGNVKIGTATDRFSYLTASTANLQIDGGVVFEPGAGNNVEIFNYRATDMLFGNSGSEAMRIDSTGRLGLGTTSPDVNLDIVDTAADVQMRVYKFDGTNNTRLTLTADDSGAKIHYRDATNGGALRFNNNAGEMARFDASGNLLVGTTSSHGKLAIGDFSATGADYGVAFVDGNDIYFVRSSTTISTNNAHYQFYNTNGNVGSITTSGSATAFNTSSDQRLKENIADADDAGSKVDAIQVRKFDWIADGSHQDYGMVAQELQSVAPEAVSEGATEEDMMGVDYSKLVPMMLKEIQSLRARVAQLEGAN